MGHCLAERQWISLVLQFKWNLKVHISDSILKFLIHYLSMVLKLVKQIMHCFYSFSLLQTYVISLQRSNLEANSWTWNLEANVWVLLSMRSYLPRSCSWQVVLAVHQGCGVVGGCGGGTAAPGAPGVPLGARQHTSLPRPTTLSIRVSWVLKYPGVS